MAGKRVFMKTKVIDGILTYSKSMHPSEGILLLRGKAKGNSITITELVIPPLSSSGEDFASFPFFMLPADFSIMGVAHSHPSGVLMPSVEDLTNFMGRLMVIAGYPYESESDVAVFDRDGRRVAFTMVGEEGEDEDKKSRTR